MDISEFEGALAAGLGRALRAARSIPVDARRACLLEACRRHRAYDPQLSLHRGRWLARVLEAGGDTEALAPRLLAELASIPDTYEFHHDASQLAELAFTFARRGVPGAREALHAALEREYESVREVVAELVIELEGLAGLELVGRSEGRALHAELRTPLSEWHFMHARELLGEAAADGALDTLARSDADIAAYRDRVLPYVRRYDERSMAGPESCENESRRSLEAQTWWNLDWPGVEERLFASPHDSIHAWCSRWGKHRATPEDLEAALRALATATDRRVVVGALRVFLHVRMPRLEPRVLTLLDDADEQIVHVAHLALHERDDEVVRQRALLRLAERRDVDYAIRLLAPTYTPRDADTIRAALPPTELAGENHDVVSALIELLGARGSASDADLVEWCYTNAAGEVCRRRAVERLQLLRQLSASIADECRFDSSISVRKVVTYGPQPVDAPLPEA